MKPGDKFKLKGSDVIAVVTQLTSDGEVGFINEGAKRTPNEHGEYPLADHYTTVENFLKERERV